MVTDPKDDAATLAMLKMMSPMVDDQRYAYEVRDVVDTEGSRDGNGGVRLHAGASSDSRSHPVNPTPGPWIAKARFTGGYHIVAVDDVLEYVVVGTAVLNDHSMETAYANAQLLAAAPKMLAALRLHRSWVDSECAGPDYGGQSRDTHPDGEKIWRAWWDNQLDLCDRANDATIAAIAAAEGTS